MVFERRLCDSDDPGSIALCAARALAKLTAEDFGLPHGSGLFDPQPPVANARRWWEQMVPEAPENQ
jgi:hypothetical protein